MKNKRKMQDSIPEGSWIDQESIVMTNDHTVGVDDNIDEMLSYNYKHCSSMQ